MYDVIVVGGGFFGCMIADHFNKQGQKVAILEKESQLFTKASKNNQARVHNGYHYPRNYLTAKSSHVNYSRFLEDFFDACSEEYMMLYPISVESKTPATEFQRMYKGIGSPLFKTEFLRLFNTDLIEEVFAGREATFDYIKLQAILLDRLKGVDIFCNLQVYGLAEGEVILEDSRTLKGKRTIVCVYAETNDLLSISNLPELPLKIEKTIMPLVRVPFQFKNMGITIMDGEFFSIFPYPSLNLHSIHHVKYTPAGGDWESIKEDVLNYIPGLEGMEHVGDIRESKAVLVQNEDDDGRPILYKHDYGFKGLDVVVGGKLDNVYDILDKLSGRDSEQLNVV